MEISRNIKRSGIWKLIMLTINHFPPLTDIKYPTIAYIIRIDNENNCNIQNLFIHNIYSEQDILYCIDINNRAVNHDKIHSLILKYNEKFILFDESEYLGHNSIDVHWKDALPPISLLKCLE